MTASDATERKPLWLSIEEKILALDPQELSTTNLEASIQRIAGELDTSGYNVSKQGGNMLELRWAMGKAAEVGRPFLKDLNSAVDTFTLEDVKDAYAITSKLIDSLGRTWSVITKANNRAEVIKIVENRRLDLLIAKAKEMPGDTGIRMLIEEKVAAEVIIEAMGITREKLGEVNAAIEAERAERDRVLGLLEKVGGKPDDEKVRHLFANDVAEELIVSIAGIGQAVVDGVKKAMEEELKERERLAAEAAAKKKAEAEGPPLEEISPEDMLYHIESIREIMEFSDQEKEIRVMCEQSVIPKCLVDIAISEPAKLDELEKQAGG
jgi:hypothetical protein